MSCEIEMEEFEELSSGIYEADIVQDNGSPAGLGVLTALTLTLYDEHSDNQAIVNERNDQDVLNANNVTIDASGHLKWNIQPDDNAILDSNNYHEDHIAMFKYEWLSGGNTRRGYHRARLRVTNLSKVE